MIVVHFSPFTFFCRRAAIDEDEVIAGKGTPSPSASSPKSASSPREAAADPLLRQRKQILNQSQAANGKLGE